METDRTLGRAGDRTVVGLAQPAEGAGASRQAVRRSALDVALGLEAWARADADAPYVYPATLDLEPGGTWRSREDRPPDVRLTVVGRLLYGLWSARGRPPRARIPTHRNPLDTTGSQW